VSHDFNRGGKPSGPGSQFDSQQTLKLGFDDNLQSHRFHDSESPVFDRLEAETDVDGNFTKLTYYVADKHEVFDLTITTNIGGVLNSKYFTLGSAYDRVKYYIWFNSDGFGVDPNIVDHVGIEVALSAGDSAIMIAELILTAVNNTKEIAYILDVKRNSDKLLFYTKREGPVTTNSIGDTSFTLNTTQEGTEEISDIYSYTYDASGNMTGMFKV